jgi:hypothetical protein
MLTRFSFNAIAFYLSIAGTFRISRSSVLSFPNENFADMLAKEGL